MTPTKRYLQAEVDRLALMLTKREAKVADAKTKLADAKRRLRNHRQPKAAKT